MSIWNEFAKLVDVAPRHVEDALHSERAAQATLSRRGMFGASAALAAGVAFGFPEVPKNSPKVFRLTVKLSDQLNADDERSRKLLFMHFDGWVLA